MIWHNYDITLIEKKLDWMNDYCETHDCNNCTISEACEILWRKDHNVFSTKFFSEDEYLINDYGHSQEYLQAVDRDSDFQDILYWIDLLTSKFYPKCQQFKCSNCPSRFSCETHNDDLVRLAKFLDEEYAKYLRSKY